MELNHVEHMPPEVPANNGPFGFHPLLLLSYYWGKAGSREEWWGGTGLAHMVAHTHMVVQHVIASSSISREVWLVAEKAGMRFID